MEDPAQKFDAYADEYRSLVDTNVQASGESAEYFTEYKLRCLLRLGAPTTEPILDFGAGTGTLTALLTKQFSDVTAYELSPASLEHARKQAPDARCTGDLADLPAGHYATAVCAGVLHHVPPEERKSLLETVRRTLKPGGRLFVFEHNPLNPLTQRAVSTCPFDDDAIMLWPWEIRPLFRSAGFSVQRLDYIVFFPRLFAKLRPLEPYLRHVVFGAQTMTVGENPG
jgi:SAM-dependent methyltransferase